MDDEIYWFSNGRTRPACPKKVVGRFVLFEAKRDQGEVRELEASTLAATIAEAREVAENLW